MRLPWNAVNTENLIEIVMCHGMWKWQAEGGGLGKEAPAVYWYLGLDCDGAEVRQPRRAWIES